MLFKRPGVYRIVYIHKRLYILVYKFTCYSINGECIVYSKCTIVTLKVYFFIKDKVSQFKAKQYQK